MIEMIWLLEFDVGAVEDLITASDERFLNCCCKCEPPLLQKDGASTVLTVIIHFLDCKLQMRDHRREIHVDAAIECYAAYWRHNEEFRRMISALKIFVELDKSENCL